LVAPVFDAETRAERVARATFVANGIVSVATALLTAAVPGWALTPAGIAGYVAWNVLVIALAAAAFFALRARSIATAGSARVRRR
jgi:hypothetical protein